MLSPKLTKVVEVGLTALSGGPGPSAYGELTAWERWLYGFTWWLFRR